MERARPTTWAHTRVPVGLVIGVGSVFVTLAVHRSLTFAILVGWIVGATVVDVWTWATIWPLDPPRTRMHASLDDPGRRLADIILVVSSVASLGAIAELLLQHPGSAKVEVAQAALTVVSIALAWWTVHTVFTVRYAREYFAPPEGGIDFNEDDPPQYTDFAYFAFTIGMSFAVSDTNVGKKTIRRLALQHALFSYLLGAIVIGATVNLLVSLP